ncbi:MULTISPECIES: hypothetical protein [Hafnia]|uniref:hypothetical protein n=1 Tax=Hafnia TaxID=568 RepID=UPI000B1A742B|nr:hypothetical protein [Hafnia paralvei]MCE9949072.1 hypothetical protein [Hafnia paralvei]
MISAVLTGFSRRLQLAFQHGALNRLSQFLQTLVDFNEPYLMKKNRNANAVIIPVTHFHFWDFSK